MDRRRLANYGVEARRASPSSRTARLARRAAAVPVLITLAALGLGACGSSSGGGATGSGGAIAGSLTQPGLYGKLPPAGTPTRGGTITYGQLNGQTPNYILPIVPSGNASV
ncbi:MAG TPA: hypothetical protein VIX82_08920, partial [Solirubrobacteraceae bacterium]